jgi:hypothetical protein
MSLTVMLDVSALFSSLLQHTYFVKQLLPPSLFQGILKNTPQMLKKKKCLIVLTDKMKEVVL